MKHGVLKTFHPMVGVDFHCPWVPGTPAPATSPVPYGTFAPMIGPTMVTATYAGDFYSHYYGQTMLKVTDIGPFIPHVGPPSNLIPLEMGLSSSKSYFGSSRFKSKGKPIAVSLLFVVNPNLNCGTPVPTPTGVVLAITTHRVDMTWGDIFSGILQMCCDIAVQWALNKLGSSLGNFISGRLGAAMVRRFSGEGLAAVEFVLALDRAMTNATTTGNAVGALAVAVAGFFFGSPMGMDAATFGTYGQDGQGENRGGPGDMIGAGLSNVADSSGQAIGDYLDGGLPNGYPVEFGTSGADDVDTDLMEHKGH
ncbi:MAG: hypothetical protein HY881_09370 [Deltaproteobacteria bacterium]|nr:hypothetical protein [Deltaproteobacteria bacterium]